MSTASSQSESQVTPQEIAAFLVYDGGNTVHIPPQMGLPRKDQMRGTPAEQLVELAGRVCYDSLGKGRPSFSRQDTEFNEPIGDGGGESVRSTQGYHDHIAQVGHGSVLEHFNFTVEMNFSRSAYDDNRKMLIAWNCMNRPGVMCMPVGHPTGLRVTANLRSIREWLTWTKELYGKSADQFNLTAGLAHRLTQNAATLAPAICKNPDKVFARHDGEFWDEINAMKICEPINDHEKWVSLFLAGSRGLSHEQVRHGDFTAISQRSTRYCDESESEWIEHPLTEAYKKEHWGEGPHRSFEPEVIREARSGYRQTVKTLQSWLLSRGVDKTSARKQARGAARGFLGNALYTEMIFSANVAQWKRMIRQRGSVFADAEIRELYVYVLRELRKSRYAEDFSGFTLAPSSDGIGQVIVEA